jgi:anti-sigma regulatory factor (Ser/Thr protein kinase)
MDWMVLADDAQTVPPLRREIIGFLRRQARPDGDFASAELVIGELLSNAVAHGPARARVTLRWDGDHPVLSVADVGRAGAGAGAAGFSVHDLEPRELPELPEAVLPADPLADRGRGLFIADQLSRGLAVRARATGSVVSATLDLHRRPAPAASTGQTAAADSALPA